MEGQEPEKYKYKPLFIVSDDEKETEKETAKQDRQERQKIYFIDSDDEEEEDREGFTSDRVGFINDPEKYKNLLIELFKKEEERHKRHEREKKELKNQINKLIEAYINVLYLKSIKK